MKPHLCHPTELAVNPGLIQSLRRVGQFSNITSFSRFVYSEKSTARWCERVEARGGEGRCGWIKNKSVKWKRNVFPFSWELGHFIIKNNNSSHRDSYNNNNNRNIHKSNKYTKSNNNTHINNNLIHSHWVTGGRHRRRHRYRHRRSLRRHARRVCGTHGGRSVCLSGCLSVRPSVYRIMSETKDWSFWPPFPLICICLGPVANEASPRSSTSISIFVAPTLSPPPLSSFPPPPLPRNPPLHLPSPSLTHPCLILSIKNVNLWKNALLFDAIGVNVVGLCGCWFCSCLCCCWCSCWCC